MKTKSNVLIISTLASENFGGEAILPLHYFKRMPQYNFNLFLLTHTRNRDELNILYPNNKNIYYVEDTTFHKLLSRLASYLPDRIAAFSTSVIIDIATQISQRRKARELVKEKNISLIHIPIRVSPKYPDIMSDMGANVIYGPLNGGMDYPDAFKNQLNWLTQIYIKFGRLLSNYLTFLTIGKRNATAIFVANERTRFALPRTKCKNIHTLPENGVDLCLFQNDKKIKNDNNSYTFCYMGRLVDWKRVDILIHSIDKLKKDGIDARLIILGDGNLKDDLKALTDSLNLNKNIEFKGFLKQAECAEYLSSSDCLLLSSINECGGAVVLEAMSMGTPVIASDWGGPADYLDESCGILISTQNGESGLISGFTEAMRSLVKNPEFGEELGRNGRKKVYELYDWNKKCEIMASYYERYDSQLIQRG